MKELSERDTTVIWHPYTQMKNIKNPVVIEKGEGAYLYDEKGMRYIDAISSWWVNTHGHCNKYIAEKVSEQLKTLEHVIFAGFTHKPAVTLAERLLERLASGQTRVFYSDNGSTAVEVALKMAFQYWTNKGKQKKKVIALHNAYHGDTFGAMSVSGRSIFSAPFSDFLFDVHFVDVPVKGMEDKVLSELKKIVNHEDIAAFIFEPLVQGAAGMVMYEPEILEKMISVCKEKNILTIADEVMTGFYRTGNFFASDRLKNKPDIFCMSKGITGGFMALGVTTCTDEVFNAFLSDDNSKTFFHGHSYTANPLACAAANASMDLYNKPQCEENVLRISFRHDLFRRQLKFIEGIRDVRQTGTILAIELETPEATSYLNKQRDEAYRFFMSKGILMRPLGNVIYLIPPYCISDDDLEYVYDNILLFLTSKKL